MGKKEKVSEVRRADLVVASSRLLVSKAYEDHVDALIGAAPNDVVYTAADQLTAATKRWEQKSQRYEQYLRYLSFSPKADAPGKMPVLKDFKDKHVKAKETGDSV